MKRTNQSKIAAPAVEDQIPHDHILHDHNHDGIDRRGFLKCMAWAGTGAFCVIKGGVLSFLRPGLSRVSTNMPSKGELSFVQISDSHMGFDKAANPDVVGTFKAAIDKINALPAPPAFILHTGDISHLSKPSRVRHRRSVAEDRQRQRRLLCAG